MLFEFHTNCFPEDDDSVVTEIYSIISDAGVLGVTGAELQSKTAHLKSVVTVIQKMMDNLIVYRFEINLACWFMNGY
jgi:hypothetical protein